MLLMVSLAVKKLFNLMKYHLIIFAFAAFTSGIRLKKKKKNNYYQHGCERAYTCFLLQVGWFGVLHLLILTSTLGGWCYYSHFTADETEAQEDSCLYILLVSYGLKVCTYTMSGTVTCVS